MGYAAVQGLREAKSEWEDEHCMVKGTGFNDDMIPDWRALFKPPLTKKIC